MLCHSVIRHTDSLPNKDQQELDDGDSEFHVGGAEPVYQTNVAT